jgi:hypothetical protein
MIMILEEKHLSILNHTETRAANRHFHGNPDGMSDLVDAGLMKLIGNPSPIFPDKIFTITEEGSKRLSRIKNAVA